MEPYIASVWAASMCKVPLQAKESLLPNNFDGRHRGPPVHLKQSTHRDTQLEELIAVLTYHRADLFLTYIKVTYKGNKNWFCVMFGFSHVYRRRERLGWRSVGFLQHRKTSLLFLPLEISGVALLSFAGRLLGQSQMWTISFGLKESQSVEHLRHLSTQVFLRYVCVCSFNTVSNIISLLN